MKIKNSNSTNLVYMRKLDIKEIKLILSLIIFYLKKQINNFVFFGYRVNNFVIKNRVIYQFIFNSVLRKLYYFGSKNYY